MGEKEWEPIGVFDLFGDGLARRILVLASEQPLSADQLADTLDASHPTIYRRVNALLEYDLLREEQKIDSEGNHYKTFETKLRRISFEIDDGGYDVELQLRQNLVDQFGDFWSGLGESSVGDAAEKETLNDQTGNRRDTHHG